MLTFKILWKSEFFPNYSVYTGNKYVVSKVDDPNGGYVHLLIDGDSDNSHSIHLGNGTQAFIMNSSGATVDRIFVDTTGSYRQ